MTPDVVVDIGNSRMKWGRVGEYKVVEMVSLPLDDERTWAAQIEKWKAGPVSWAVASVNPPVAERFRSWAGNTVFPITNRHAIPLDVDVDEPDRVGIDRLLNAFAYAGVYEEQPAVLIGVGTALTVDYLDERNVFRGGAILPGPRLMARSLREATAKLPLLADLNLIDPPVPGRNTEDAIRLGIAAAVIGALDELCRRYAKLSARAVHYVVTGGDAPLLAGPDGTMWSPGLSARRTFYVPELTLSGILRAARASA